MFNWTVHHTSRAIAIVFTKITLTCLSWPIYFIESVYSQLCHAQAIGLRNKVDSEPENRKRQQEELLAELSQKRAEMDRYFLYCSISLKVFFVFAGYHCMLRQFTLFRYTVQIESLVKTEQEQRTLLDHLQTTEWNTVPIVLWATYNFVRGFYLNCKYIHISSDTFKIFYCIWKYETCIVYCALSPK